MACNDSIAVKYVSSGTAVAGSIPGKFSIFDTPILKNRNKFRIRHPARRTGKIFGVFDTRNPDLGDHANHSTPPLGVEFGVVLQYLVLSLTEY